MRKFPRLYKNQAELMEDTVKSRAESHGWWTKNPFLSAVQPDETPLLPIGLGNIRCECGVDALGEGNHSNWCPKSELINNEPSKKTASQRVDDAIADFLARRGFEPNYVDLGTSLFEKLIVELGESKTSVMLRFKTPKGEVRVFRASASKSDDYCEAV